MKKLLYAGLSLLMCASILPCNIYAAEKEETENEKEETVYVINDAAGKTNETIVSTWLKNNTDSKTISDKCNIENVENLKGKEKYTSSNGVNTWTTKKGEDIYYQGISKENSPVNVKVTYTLNGKEVKPEEIAGKKGEVKVHYEYINTASENVNGHDYSVAFMMITAMYLDGDNFSNVTIDNGKVINDGDRYIVVGYGLPGLSKDLGVSSNALEGFTISATTTNFKTSDSLTVASNEVLNELDLSKVNDLSSLTAQINTLSSSADELENGSKQLNNGLLELQAKLPALSDGIYQLVSGSSRLASGTAALVSGTNTLKDGTSQLNSKYAALNSGISSASKGSSALYNGLCQVSAGVDELVKGQASLSAGLNKVSGGISTLKDSLTSILNANTQASSYVTLSIDSIKTIKANLDAVIATLPESDAVQKAELSQLSASLATYTADESGQVQVSDGVLKALGGASAYMSGANNGLTQAVAALSPSGNHDQALNGNLADAIYQLQSGDNALGLGLNGNPEDLVNNPGLVNAVKSLTAGSNDLKTGLNAANSGSALVSEGLSSLDSGASSMQSASLLLNEGTNTLFNGLNSANGSIPELINGVKELSEGSTSLANGMAKFNAEGIKKIVNLFEGDVKSLLSNFDNVITASKNYKSFTGLSSDMDGKVKFIIKTAAVK